MEGKQLYVTLEVNSQVSDGLVRGATVGCFGFHLQNS